MMTRKLLQKKDLEKLVKALEKKQVAFHAPVRDGETVDFTQIGPKDEICFDYTNTALPPKRLVRPACQQIGVIEGDEIKEASASGAPAVIFGVRPCDALSFTRLDKVFLEGDYTDDFYKEQRDSLTVVSLACQTSDDTCFCTSLGAGPESPAGADILALDLGQKLLWEACSKKGEALLKDYASCFSDPTDKDLAEREKEYPKTKAAADRFTVPGKDTLLANFHSPAWEAVAETCLGCNVCTFFCPTCHCFTIADDQGHETGRRLRIEDSCLSAGFTHEASGHNPRPTARERMRQRIMHKFAYTNELFGETFCVGCGRCIVNCPAHIDIRETLAKVSE
jgi:ferredoxin